MSKTLFNSKPPGRRSGHQVLALREDPGGSGDFFVLLVDFAHQDGLTLPGGSAEQNELPHLAARRHLETQTGLVLPLRTILTVDYSPAAELPEALDFVYAGGVVTSRQAGAIRPHQPPEGIRALHWAPQAKLRRVMADDQYRRVEDAWDAWEHGAGLPLLIQGVPVPVG
ncbi:NUDIX domain-containing protein [Streptomyces sp. NRRL S-350]|uniref:NUDIX domain-containing protein n=1 Tax=Streptomyces sp. NRRL S-350 TaxID=1463902 RepID=UPI0006923774|nr:NUDIX hydrolase [Streptomyces sp. NRRL S-350]